MERKWLTRLFENLGLKAKPPEKTYPDQMWLEVVSKPDATVTVHRVHLTRAQTEGLTLSRNAFLPGSR